MPKIQAERLRRLFARASVSPQGKMFALNVRPATLLTPEEAAAVTWLGRKVLTRLRVSTGWHTPKQLADVLRLNRNSVTPALLRLVAAGLVERKPVDPERAATVAGYAYRAIPNPGPPVKLRKWNKPRDRRHTLATGAVVISDKVRRDMYAKWVKEYDRKHPQEKKKRKRKEQQYDTNNQ